jgi:hypothetical protein
MSSGKRSGKKGEKREKKGGDLPNSKKRRCGVVGKQKKQLVFLFVAPNSVGFQK